MDLFKDYESSSSDENEQQNQQQQMNTPGMTTMGGKLPDDFMSFDTAKIIPLSKAFEKDICAMFNRTPRSDSVGGRNEGHE
jgi:hypothetical protein